MTEKKPFPTLQLLHCYEANIKHEFSQTHPPSIDSSLDFQRVTGKYTSVRQCQIKVKCEVD